MLKQATLLLILFLALPFTGWLMTPRITLPVTSAATSSSLPLAGDCLQCQLGANAAWFSAYDLCRSQNLPIFTCILIADRASDCYITNNWAQCQWCGGVQPACGTD